MKLKVMVFTGYGLGQGCQTQIGVRATLSYQESIAGRT